MINLDHTLRGRLSKYLTTDVLETLAAPDQSSINQAIQRLSSLHSNIKAFLPPYIAENEDLLTEDFGHLSQGTFMFADVSGFTALSETLMREAGSEGIEVLTKCFNDYFTAMLEILAALDGHLLKFAGDALLCFFPSSANDKDALDAINAGLRMQAAMKEKFQPIADDELTRLLGQHNLELTMSIGIAQGVLFETLVGSTAQRDHIIMGALPGQAMAAEEVGQRDEVIIDKPLQEKFTHLLTTRPLTDEFYEVLKISDEKESAFSVVAPQKRRGSAFVFSFEDDPQALIRSLEDEVDRLEIISRFVSPEIVNKLVVTKRGRIESENRLATVIFANFTGFAELLDAWGHENIDFVTIMLSRYYNTMQRIIVANGGVLTRSDPYKLGCKLLITFGAPVAHPDDPDRAVATSLEMNRQLANLNQHIRDEFPEIAHLYPVIKQRMGITQGQVFAGEAGWKQRREYTVMGDDVNLAARLMNYAAFGQILVSEQIYERVNPYFVTEALDEFHAKGKTKPIRPYVVKEAKRRSISTTSDTPFIGRETLLTSLSMNLMQTQNRPRNVRALGLVGEIGVGKTRLAKQLAQLAERTGFKVAWATCRSQNSRKATWATLVSQLLDLDTTQSVEDQKAVLNAKMTALALDELIDEFEDLIFNLGDQSPARKDGQQRTTKSSKARSELFSKLFYENETQFDDEDTLTRDQARRALRSAGTSDIPIWSALELGTSLGDAIKEFLEAYAKETPILLVIDNLHHENARALGIFNKIIQGLDKTRLMIVVTYERVIKEGREINISLSKLDVPDFPRDETDLMATTILNAEGLGPRLSKYIWDSSSGRALFIESLLQTLIENEQLYEAQGIFELKEETNLDAVPDNVRGLLISRIDRLPHDARGVARVAAVLGENFSIPALTYVSELRDTGRMADAIDELLKRHIFEEIGDQEYRFKHGLAGQAVYEELTRLQRQKFHLKVAEFYKQTMQIEQSLLLMVHHMVKAGKLDEASRALRDAALRAESNGNLESAADLYSRALEIFPDGEIEAHVRRLNEVS